MALVNHSVTNLIQGVSQQSPAVRLDNQLEEQINCFSDVTKGLTIKNGLELVNILQEPLEESNIIEFTIDGVEYLVSLDANNLITPLSHIPLSADIEKLDTEIPNLDYFNNTKKGDIKILEDKDKVYILNTSRQVAEVSLGNSFIDIRITDDKLNEVNSRWVTGSYELDILSVIDPESGGTATQSKVIAIDKNLSLIEITDLINNDTNFIEETGKCFITGNISSYRITFPEIPIDFLAPSVTLTVISTLSRLQRVNVSEIYNKRDNNHYVATNNNGAGPSRHWYFGGFIKATNSNVSFWSVTGGPNNRRTFYSAGVSTGVGFKSITQVIEETLPFDYTIEVIPSTIEDAENNLSLHVSQEGMIWVTGVLSAQKYGGKITYHDITDPLLTPQFFNFASIDVSGVSTIKLNWVADQVRSQLQSSGLFDATQYDGAVYFKVVNTNFVVDDIEMTNNFDNSSIDGVPAASLTNGKGILALDTLPPLFAEGFKVRIGNEDNPESSFYLAFDRDYRGWRETGLDNNRLLDPSTMPHVIDKEKVRRTGVITIEPEVWQKAKAGDSESNKSPTFVSKNIKDIFFYGSRLGFATDDTIIMSAIDATDTFYRITASKTLINERVDIKLDSSKVGFDTIKSVTTFNQKLFINTGSAQSVLLVNNSFDLTKARLAEVSSYSLGDTEPLPVEGGLYFATTSGGFSSVLSYQGVESKTYNLNDLTKHCPTYIKGTVDKMVYSNNFAVISVLEDRRTLYVQNRFDSNSELLQNAWHKWELPYDIQHITFIDNSLHIIMTSEFDNDPYLMIGKYDLRIQIVEEVDETTVGTINWKPYLDLYTKDKTLIENFPEFIGINERTGVKFNSVEEAFLSSATIITDLTNETIEEFEKDISPNFYWLVEGNLNTIVFDDGLPIQAGGGSTIDFFDAGDGFRYYKGADNGSGYFGVFRAEVVSEEIFNDTILYGVPFKASIVLSSIISRNNSTQPPTVMTYSKLILRRMRLFLAKTGHFRVLVTFKDRKDFVMVSNISSVGRMTVGSGTADDGIYNFPLNGQSDLITITIETDSSTPFNLLATEWQGQLITKGRNI